MQLCDACGGCSMLTSSARDPTLSVSCREGAEQLWASVLSYCCSASLPHKNPQLIYFSFLLRPEVGVNEKQSVSSGNGLRLAVG